MLDNGHNLNVLPGAQLREGYKTIRDINDPLWPNYLLNVTPARLIHFENHWIFGCMKMFHPCCLYCH